MASVLPSEASMPVCYRLILLFLLPATFLLSACESALDIDAGPRKEIPLDPPDTTARVRPDSVIFELYLVDGWEGDDVLLSPSGGSSTVFLNTTGQTPFIWIDIDYA